MTPTRKAPFGKSVFSLPPEKPAPPEPPGYKKQSGKTRPTPPSEQHRGTGFAGALRTRRGKAKMPLPVRLG